MRVGVADVIDIVSVVGARPQFVKLAPIARSLGSQAEIVHRVIHTGQHYDDQMSAVFFEELELPKPDEYLGVGSGTHAVQTAGMLMKLEQSFRDQRPDCVLVYGDTNSTLAATLAAVKLQIPIAHIEAGLRSFNRQMPEEINRIVADHCSDRLYAPTPAAMVNLDNENMTSRAVLSGDVMRDAVQFNSSMAQRTSRVLQQFDLTPGEFGVLTIHRPVNTTPSVLSMLLGTLSSDDSPVPLLFPVHPRTRQVIDRLETPIGPRIRLADPVPYLDMLRLVEAAAVILTDSGGVQKEAAFLATPCVTLREETEWTETIVMGVNCLVGQSPPQIRDALQRVSGSGHIFTDSVMHKMDEHYGRGDAAAAIVNDLSIWLGTTPG